MCVCRQRYQTLNLVLNLVLFGTPNGLWSCLMLKCLNLTPADGGDAKRLLQIALILNQMLF
jgi:hypothetical protein